MHGVWIPHRKPQCMGIVRVKQEEEADTKNNSKIQVNTLQEKIVDST